MKTKTFEIPDIPRFTEMFALVESKVKRLNFVNWTIANDVIKGNLHSLNQGYNWAFYLDDIGKTVFFTRKEAKNALGLLKGEGEGL